MRPSRGGEARSGFGLRGASCTVATCPAPEAVTLVVVGGRLGVGTVGTARAAPVKGVVGFDVFFGASPSMMGGGEARADGGAGGGGPARPGAVLR